MPRTCRTDTVGCSGTIKVHGVPGQLVSSKVGEVHVFNSPPAGKTWRMEITYDCLPDAKSTIFTVSTTFMTSLQGQGHS
jgi:hypothetical protein